MKQWFYNLKVKKKLIYSYLLLVIFIAAIAGISFFNMSNIYSSTVALSNNFLPSTDLLLQIDRDMYQAVLAQRIMTYTPVGTPAFDQLIKDNNENIGQVKTRWAKYKKIKVDGTDEEFIKKYDENVVDLGEKFESNSFSN